MAYIGLWYGGTGYAEGYWAKDLEIFETLEHAKDVLRARKELGYTPISDGTFKVDWDDEGQPYRGEKGLNLDTPAVDESSNILLAPLNGSTLEALEQDGYYACSHLVEFGTRGGVKVTAL